MNLAHLYAPSSRHPTTLQRANSLKMRIQLLPTILLGGITVACALPLNASISGNVDDIAYTAGDGYPDAIASDEIWDKYQKKGNHYQCLFEANDEGAGYLIEDKRTPPSAQSVWKGDMIGRWNSPVQPHSSASYS